MYNDILELAKVRNNILFHDLSKKNEASRIVRLILSNFSLKDTIIIDKEEDVEFIKKNLILDPTITICPHNSIAAYRYYKDEGRNNDKNFIVVGNSDIEEVQIDFDYKIEVKHYQDYFISEYTENNRDNIILRGTVSR